MRNLGLLLLILVQAPAIAAIPNVMTDGEPFPTLAPMLKQINPAVVNISTYSTRETQYNPLLNDPFFRRFFNLPDNAPDQQQAPERRQQAAGSGVIVDAKKGIVITNYHVVRGADEVRVSLIDGRNLGARVLGSDPQLDIAILEVEADDLTEIEFADSSQLEVGDFVVAIGNPFGLGQTVTTGIVSALGRSGLGIEGYEDFIQTDASINPGNSGGALVNLAGKLVGINTAILAPAGGNVGIGFAIPINMAKSSIKQILEYGEVRRGQIGVGIQEITPDLRDAFELKKGQFGVLISKVFEASPAEKAGLKSGDVILEVDGQPISSTAQLRSRVGIKQVGEKVSLTILREGKVLERSVEIGSVQPQTAQSANLPEVLSGLQIDNNPDGNGVQVAGIAPNSAAAYSGLRPGDIIVSANRQVVGDVDSFRRAVGNFQGSILLQVERDGGSLFIVIR
ncbi:MAG TPA: DegQ family serine endoprotease [Gammaproteobacteria bacterium]|nr:DegQ family serine endoprotease [Gammaproteobacteria bacterium]